MENIKYTTDGRKVAFMGKLNAKEMIIQEIFIQKDGTEIPSGENSIIDKNFLLDEPVISWKQKALNDLNSTYEKDRKEYLEKIDNLKKDYDDSTRQMRLKFDFIGKALKKADKSVFDTLVDYITGDIKWVILHNYGSHKLIPFDELNQEYDKKLRLISLFGEANGDLSYHVGSYSDYSGSSNKISVYRYYDSAVLELKEIIENLESYNQDNIDEAVKHKISLDHNKVIEFMNKKSESFNTTITDLENSLKRKREEKETFLLNIEKTLKNIF
jgi:hypothetical protein